MQFNKIKSGHVSLLSGLSVAGSMTFIGEKSYNNLTNTLSGGTFSGTLIGNASTTTTATIAATVLNAITATSALTAITSTTALNASQVYINHYSSGGLYYTTLVSSLGEGVKSLFIDAVSPTLIYNPSNSTLNASIF